MIEDKLFRTERIRLEALAQSIAWHSRFTASTLGVHTVLETATEFEKYVLGNGEPLSK